MSIRFISTLIGIAVSAAALAQSEVTEKTVVNKPDKVTVTRHNKKVTISIDGKEGNPEYRYYNQFAIDDGTTETLNEAEDRREWNFSLPLDLKKRDNRSRRRCRCIRVPDFSGFGIGMVTAVDAADEIDVDMAASYEFTWTILSLEKARWSNRRWSHAIGFGLNWRNYRMTGRKRFVQDGDQLIVGNYPEGANPDFSRIKIFSLMVPYTMAYSFNKHVDLQFGPVVNFNTYASVKTRYTTDEGKQKDFFKGIHQRNVTLDLHAKLSYDRLGFYMKYSPFSPIKTDFAPSFHGLSVGVMMGY